MNERTANATITIDVPAAKVWEALTKPELVKQYLFGAEVISDWKVGGPLNYRGEWEGKQYEDKGTILEINPNELLMATYFSPMSGREDKPENYQNVSYKLTENDGITTLEIGQDNIKTEDAKTHYGRPTKKSEGHAFGGEGHLRIDGRPRVRGNLFRRRPHGRRSPRTRTRPSIRPVQPREQAEGRARPGVHAPPGTPYPR